MAANVTLATQQEKQAYLANQRQLKTRAKDILDRGGGITSIPYQTYSGIDPKGREAIDGYAKAGGRITTDPVTFRRLRDQAPDHPQDFLDTDLNDYIHLVDGKDMPKLSTLQQTLKDKGPDDPAFSLQRVKGQSADVMQGMLGLPTRLTEPDDGIGRGNANHGSRAFFDREPDGSPNHRSRANKVEAKKDDIGPGDANHSGRASSDYREGGSSNHRAKPNKGDAEKDGAFEPPTFTFELNGKAMSALQDQDGKSFPAFSGLLGAINDPSKAALEKIGPLPQGTYYIVNREPGGRRYRIRQWFEELGLSDIGGWLTRADKDEWFALYRADGTIDDVTTVNGVQRDQFRLHYGTISEGCITVNTEADYAKIREKLLIPNPALFQAQRFCIMESSKCDRGCRD